MVTHNPCDTTAGPAERRSASSPVTLLKNSDPTDLANCCHASRQPAQRGRYRQSHRGSSE
eukprot:515373-Alexandrium_andersonii.AAC.1